MKSLSDSYLVMGARIGPDLPLSPETLATISTAQPPSKLEVVGMPWDETQISVLGLVVSRIDHDDAQQDREIPFLRFEETFDAAGREIRRFFPNWFGKMGVHHIQKAVR